MAVGIRRGVVRREVGECAVWYSVGRSVGAESLKLFQECIFNETSAQAGIMDLAQSLDRNIQYTRRSYTFLLDF
jgi:hypothetical protein